MLNTSTTITTVFSHFTLLSKKLLFKIGENLIDVQLTSKDDINSNAYGPN